MLAVALVGCELRTGTAAPGTIPALERATPESVGISSERLGRLHDGMQQLVDEGRLAGITTMVARRGKVVDFQTYGFRDIEKGHPMTEDAIFRIYSMSKPITSVARMMLYEEGMVDTGFHVPEQDHDRLVQYYGYDREGKLVARTGGSREVGSRPYLDPTSFFSGGGGLVSTTSDYMRFAQMLLSGGELDGVRILSPTTVALMTRNQMPRENPERRPGVGFGLDFSVVLDAVGREYVSVGEYSWGGAAGTWFWIDPVEELVFVGMIQQQGRGRPNVRAISHQLTYQAIVEQ